MRALRLLTALALLGVAGVHLAIAGDYVGLGSHPLALSDQFYVQAAAGIALAGAVLWRPRLVVWFAVVGFAVGSLAALLYSRYRCLPIYGFDGCFQETWAARGAKLAAVTESAALVLGLAGAWVTARPTR
jgi:hypothetical protein